MAQGQSHCASNIISNSYPFHSTRVDHPIPEIQPFQYFTLKIQGQGHSTESGPNLCPIWQVFGPWASPYEANGQTTMTVHSYSPRQFHRTWNGEHLSSGYRDKGSTRLAAASLPKPWWKYPSSPDGPKGLMGKMGLRNVKKVYITNLVFMRISNEALKLLLYQTHLLPRSYFYIHKVFREWLQPSVPFMGQQIGNCLSFTMTQYLNVFAMHCGPRASPLCIQQCIQLTFFSFQVNQPSLSWDTAISIFYLENPMSMWWVRSRFKVTT